MSKLNTAALQAMDAAHYLHPFTDHKELGERGTRPCLRGAWEWIKTLGLHRGSSVAG